MRVVRRRTLQELQALPTLEVGVSSDLKIRTKTQRVWLSRLQKVDGASCDNMVYVDFCDSKGNWNDVDSYQAVDEMHLLEITIRPKPVNAAPLMWSQIGAIVDAFNGVETSDQLEDEK